jgi:hypothetical protein
MNINIIMN